MDYYNLSQNLTGRLVYIRSTDIEQHNWRRLLWSVPDEWLFLLSKDEEIVINDITSNHNGGKIKKVFCPVLSDVLNYLLFDSPPQYNLFKHHYRDAMAEIDDDNLLKTKFLFWRKKIKKYVTIVGKSILVDKEPNPLELK